MTLKFIRSTLRFPALGSASKNLPVAAFVFIGYWLGAQIAFFVGTFSDRIFAPFWPPNVILLSALLCVPRGRGWVCVAAALPAHVLAESQVGMAISSSLVAFSANILVAILSAVAIRRWLRAPLALDDFRRTSLFVAIVGFACPALAAFVGAFVPVLGGQPLQYYPTYWLQWFAANVLGYLTLGPLAITLANEGTSSFRSAPFARQAEALLLGLALIAVSNFAFEMAADYSDSGFLPALLYSPIPLILWAAARFGTRGVSATISAMTVVLLWRTLNGQSPFLAGTAETNVLSLQLFLIGFAGPMLLLGSSIDEARRIGLRLREDEERMTSVAAQANVGLWQANTTTGHFWTTDHCRAMLGLAPDIPVTKDAILNIVHPDDRHIANEAIATRNVHAFPTEFRIIRPDGDVKWILARSNSRNISGAEETTSSGMLSDITERKSAEAEADLQRREIAHLMRVSQISELSSGLAHELTQPLTAILSNAQAACALLASEPPDLIEISEALNDIIQEDHRARDVIHRLRSFLKNGKDVFETVDINELLNSTLRLLKSEIISRRIKTDFAHTSDPALVSGDPVQLQQVLINLIMNSIESVSHMARLRRFISLKVENVTIDELQVSVSDRGTGISQADQDRLFEPFFTTKERGLGLGLSICYTIIKKHGGTLALDNNPNGGATARFRLPRLAEKGRTT